MFSRSGWTAGNAAAACTVVVHAMNAFNNGLGAAKQYRDSHAFLSSLYLVTGYISDARKAMSLADDAQSQIQTISIAYANFYTYVAQYAQIGYRERSDLSRALSTVRWSLNELDREVQTMKTKCSSAIAVMETLIIMDLSNRMNDLLLVVDRPDQSAQAIEKVLNDLKDHIRNLAHVSACYKTLLDFSDTTQDDQSLSSLDRENAAHDLQMIRTSLNNITKSQLQLETTLSDLTARLKRRMAIEQSAATDRETEPDVHAQITALTSTIVPASAIIMLTNPWEKDASSPKEVANVSPKQTAANQSPDTQNTTSWFDRTFTTRKASKSIDTAIARESNLVVPSQNTNYLPPPPETPMSPASNPWYTPPTISSLTFPKPTQSELVPIVDIIGGIAAVTGNVGIGAAANKIGGAVRVFGAVDPLSNTVGGWLAKAK